jgi:hypothetical protein
MSSPFELCNPSNDDSTSFNLTKQDLYGGAITMSFSSDFKDISNIRVVPDHQEVWTDGDDNTIIIELLNYKDDISTEESGKFFFNDLAEASGASSSELHYHGILDPDVCPDISSTKCGAVGLHHVAKFREEEKIGESARNQVMVYILNLRLEDVGTDVLVTMYRTIQVGESSSTTEVKKVDDDDSSDFPRLKEFMGMIKTIKIVDKGLFGG